MRKDLKVLVVVVLVLLLVNTTASGKKRKAGKASRKGSVARVRKNYAPADNRVAAFLYAKGAAQEPVVVVSAEFLAANRSESAGSQIIAAAPEVKKVDYKPKMAQKYEARPASFLRPAKKPSWQTRKQQGRGVAKLKKIHKKREGRKTAMNQESKTQRFACCVSLFVHFCLTFLIYTLNY